MNRVKGRRRTSERTREMRATFSAASMLLITGIALRLLGFKRVHKLVKRWPTFNRNELYDSQAETSLVCRAVERASSYTFTPTRCLRRSIVTVCLLRIHGIEGSLVIGINRLPFLSHAWVEVNGRMVPQAPSEEYLLKVIERI